jgi:hypothetical protein
MAAADQSVAAVAAAQAKRHQRAAVVEVHADPVPADGVGGEQRVAPFVVEPGAAGHRHRRAAAERERAASPAAAAGCSSG